MIIMMIMSTIDHDVPHKHDLAIVDCHYDILVNSDAVYAGDYFQVYDEVIAKTSAISHLTMCQTQ